MGGFFAPLFECFDYKFILLPNKDIDKRGKIRYNKQLILLKASLAAIGSYRCFNLEIVSLANFKRTWYTDIN
jgi:hypothetical protein